MNKLQRRKVYNAARRARRWAERNWRSYYCHEDMCGLCGVAAARLLIELRRDGIHARIACSDEHAFVIYRGHIIDVTATQFGEPEVLIRTYPKEEFHNWHYHATFRSVRSFVAFQEREGWPSDQIITNPNGPVV